MALILTRMPGETITVETPAGARIELIAQHVHQSDERIRIRSTCALDIATDRSYLLTIATPEGSFTVRSTLQKISKEHEGIQLRVEIQAPLDFSIKRNELMYDGDPSAKLPHVESGGVDALTYGR